MAFRPCKPEDVLKFNPNGELKGLQIMICNYNIEGIDNIRTIQPNTQIRGYFINLEKRNERTFEEHFSHYVDHYYLIYRTLGDKVVEELLDVNFGDGYRGFYVL